MLYLILPFQLEGEKRKDHSSAHSKEHYCHCKRDFDAHSCNKIIISLLHCPQCSYSLCRQSCQEARRWPSRSSSSLRQNSPVFTPPPRHTAVHWGIFLKMHPLQKRGVGGLRILFGWLVGVFCLRDSFPSWFTLQKNSRVTEHTVELAG